MERGGEWGGHLELFAAAMLFNIHIVVHQGPMRRVRIENTTISSGSQPPPPYKTLHLLFKDDHYNSLRPPPTPNLKEQSVAAKQSTRSSSLLVETEQHSPRLPTDVASKASTWLLGDALQADVEDADAGVVVRRPTRTVFQRGRPGRFSFVSTASWSSSFSTCSSERRSRRTSAAGTAKSPRRRGHETPPKAAVVVDDDAGAPVAYPRRLTFHRGVKQPTPATAAC